MSGWSGTRRGFPPLARRRILTRDDHRCRRCGHHDPTGSSLAADHRVPVAEGGSDDVSNGQTLCVDCHHDKTIEEAARDRARQPRRQRLTDAHPGAL